MITLRKVENTKVHTISQSLIWEFRFLYIHFNTAWKGKSDNTILSAYRNIIVALSFKYFKIKIENV